MKLIFCELCHDIFKLLPIYRECSCGKSGGVYLDDVNAEISGPCVPLGITDHSFVHALRHRTDVGLGSGFIAFVIPRKCDTVEHYRPPKREDHEIPDPYSGGGVRG